MRQHSLEFNQSDIAGNAATGDAGDTGRSVCGLSAAYAIPAAAQTRPLVWGLAGFLVGAVFWHLIGFWVFVSEVVLKGPELGQPAAVARDETALRLRDLAARSAGYRVRSGSAACVALALDRRSGQTRPTACIETPHPGRVALHTSRRGDRAPLRPENASAATSGPGRAPAAADVAAAD